MSLDIVFMGTPDFAVPCLDALIKEESYNVKAVFSQPDRPQGRGYKLVAPAVKKLALAHDIPVYQPTKLKDGEVLGILQGIKPDLIVVVAYGRILPKEILEVAPLGCINVHGSLLPKLRGAAPIQWSVINGDAETGITTMYMAEGLDTGDIILQSKTPIGEQETSGELFDRLAPMGAELLLETIKEIEAGTAPRIPQDESLATHAPIIKKEMAELSFDISPQEFVNRVRGFHPWPLAFTFMNETRVIVHKAEVAEGYSGKAGEVLDPKELIVGCGKGSVKLGSVQLQGKKVVSGSDFANGRRLVGGEKFNYN